MKKLLLSLLAALALSGAAFAQMSGSGGSITPSPSSGGPATFSSVTDTGLTNGRIVLVGTGGLLQDSANFTYIDGTTTGQGIFPVGAVATPGLTFRGNTGTGFYLSISGQVAFTSNGTNGLRFYNNGGGQILGGAVNSVITFGTAGGIDLASNGATSVTITTNGTPGVTVDSSQNTTFAGKAVSTSATAGVGYATGAGGAVTQLTDKTTAVTLNTVTGAVTTAATALGAGTSVGFTVNDSAVATTDYVGCSIDSGATVNSYTITVDSIGAGTFHIHLRNESAGSLSEAIVIRFVVIKAVSA